MVLSLLTIFLFCFPFISSGSPVDSWPAIPYAPYKVLDDCFSYDYFVESALVTYSISYLGNDVAIHSDISTDDRNPISASSLFKLVYSGEASAVDFKRSLMMIKYSGQGPRKKIHDDRTQLRKNLYEYAKARSFNLARTTFGELLFLVVNDFNEGFDLWKRYRCISESNLENSFAAVSFELADLRNEIGEAAMGSFLDLTSGTTLAFAIDDTGSMAGEIDAAKQRVERITEELEESIHRPQEYVLVPFNDPFIYDVTHTRDSEEFKQALRKLYAHGGGDAPEMCLTGIKVAIEKSRPGSTIYVITDNVAKDYDLQDTVIAQAKHKQIVVVFLLTSSLTGYCGTRSRYSDDNDMLMCRELYDYIAQQTGGKVLVVNKRQIFKATEIIQTGLVQGLVPIKDLQFTSKEKSEIPFEVDPTIKQLVITNEGQCGELKIESSTGKTIKNLDLYGNVFSTSLLTEGFEPGTWSIKGYEKSTKTCKTKVTARTSFGIVVTTMYKKISEPYRAYQILNGYPTNKDSILFFIDFYGKEIFDSSLGDTVSRIRFVDAQGNDVLHPKNYVSKNDKHFRQTVKVEFKDGLPANITSFFIVVEGIVGGLKFSRYSQRLFTVSSLEITSNIDDLVIRAGFDAKINFYVKNIGTKATTLSFDASEQDERVEVLRSKKETIKPGDKTVVSVRLLEIDPNVKVGTAFKITFTAKDQSTGSFQYLVVNAVVGHNEKAKINSMKVNTEIISRFAETKIQVKMLNARDIARDAVLELMLPADAFITNLTMALEDEFIIGKVEEKEKAKRVYEKAKEKNFDAGHVAVRDKLTQLYKTSLLVGPHKSVEFELTYQQLLHRKRGMYEYQLFIEPNQPVENFHASISIIEENPIEFVNLPGFKSRHSYNQKTKHHSSSTLTFSKDKRRCHVTYSPTLDIQTAHSPLGLSGVYTVQFNVARSQPFGESFISDGYFTHFFSAPFIPEPPKVVNFVIDISSSMYGIKLDQVKEALKASIEDFSSEDYFNVVFMSDDASSVFSEIRSATSANIDEAINEIAAIEAKGGTNMENAFQMAFDQIEFYVNREADMKSADFSKHSKMIIFLTDGKPTVGLTEPEKILEDIKSLNMERTNVHTIGFGTLPDMKFLEKLALQNGGVSKRIFEDFEAAIQMEYFFSDVMRPLLSDVIFKFDDKKVDEVTETNFKNIYAGKEIVLAGKLSGFSKGDFSPVKSQLIGKMGGERLVIDFEIDPLSLPEHLPDITKNRLFNEQMWAYLKIKDLLKMELLAEDKKVKEEFKEAALNLSLTHNFVTPLTSMVVLRDEDRKEIEEELEEEEYEELEKDKAEVDKIPEDMLGERVLTTMEPYTTTFSPLEESAWFYGDPHFVIPLTKDFNLCFSWHGNSNEIYNIFYDESESISVNAMMTTSPKLDSNTTQTFVSAISFVLKKKNLVIIVYPERIVLERYDGGTIYSFPVNYKFTERIGNGVTLKVTQHLYSNAKVHVKVDGINFLVILRRNLKVTKAHLDFSINQDVSKLNSKHLKGLVGQFVNANAEIKEENEQSQIRINGKEGTLLKHTTRNPKKSMKMLIPCWVSNDDAKDIIQLDHQQYLVDTLQASPNY